MRHKKEVQDILDETCRTAEDLSRPIQIISYYWSGEHLVLRIPVASEKAADYLALSINRNLRSSATEAILEIQGNTMDRISLILPKEVS